jgi:hypothetical protein
MEIREKYIDKKATNIQTFLHNVQGHVLGIRVTNLTGSRSDDWIYWRSFKIILNSDSLQSLTVYDSLHSLLAHERLPVYYDERRNPALTLNCLERCLSLESTLIHF